MRTTTIQIELDPREVVQALRQSEFAPGGVDLYDISDDDTVVLMEDEDSGRVQLVIVLER